MAMITSTTANRLGTDRSQNRPSGGDSDQANELTNYYSALLRHVQAQRADLNTQSYAVGITSCERGEGVTTIAINLAIVAARNSSRRILLVDTNTKHASAAKYLGIEAGAGLTDVLCGATLLGDALQPTTVMGLSLLSAGESRRQLGSDYDVSDVVTLLDELKSEFDLIVLDLPHADELSECYAFAEVLNGIFLVVEAGRVEGRIARRVKQRLEHCQANLLGVIYNKQA
jgi:capsular exopolysaccharide synthesis family protein